MIQMYVGKIPSNQPPPKGVHLHNSTTTTLNDIVKALTIISDTLQAQVEENPFLDTAYNRINAAIYLIEKHQNNERVFRKLDQLTPHLRKAD